MSNAITERHWFLRLVHTTVFPLFLILVCPPTAMLLWHTLVNLDGSIVSLVGEFGRQGVIGTIWKVWGPVAFGTPTAWTIIGIHATAQLVFMRLLPGKQYRGPVTPMGNVPVYKANGPLAFGLTMLLYCGLSFGLGWFSPAIIYDNFGGLLGALNVSSLVFCLGLYVKGRWFPSSTDSSVTGNFIFDYYWGTELFPRVLGWDVKMFTNCRFAMMGWPLIIISYAAKNAELYGLTDAMLVALVLQLLYTAKFFWWETGYLASLDIMHDRAGFYICWGVLVWLPSVYTCSTLYLVHQDHSLGWPVTVLLIVLGSAFIFMNYFADAQRQRVRATEGDTTIWGRKPELIHTRYSTAQGDEKQSLLLVSGFWGIGRHFHYVPEWLGALLWTVPVLFDHILPYFYVIFLFILLFHRSFRDEVRCQKKYGHYWEEYKKKVPYKFIPGIY